MLQTKERKEVVKKIKIPRKATIDLKMPASEVIGKGSVREDRSADLSVKIEATEHGTVSISQEAPRRRRSLLTVIPKKGYKAIERVVV